MFFHISHSFTSFPTLLETFQISQISQHLSAHLEALRPQLPRQRCQVLQRLADLVVGLGVQTLLGLEISGDASAMDQWMDSMDGYDMDMHLIWMTDGYGGWLWRMEDLPVVFVPSLTTILRS